MSTYSSNLRIELITTGTQAGTWGNTTNDNYQYILEQAIAGNVSVSVTSANQALTYLNGPTATASANESVRAILTLSTTTSANFAIYAPPVSKQYTIYNTSAYTATIYNSTAIGNTTAAGTGVAVPAGKTVTVYSDGTNFYPQNGHLVDGTTAATQISSDNSTKVATTAFVQSIAGSLGTMSSQNANAVAITGGTIGAAVTGSTQSAGTSNTTLATTAFVQAALQALYPVGSVYINAAVDTNPATLLGFGTWATVGDGKVMVNQDTTDTSFDVLGETGGSKDAIVVSHTHTATVTDPGHTHTITTLYNGGGFTQAYPGAAGGIQNNPSTSSATTGITVSNSTTGSSGTNANLQPYVVVRMWKRTA